MADSLSSLEEQPGRLSLLVGNYNLNLHILPGKNDKLGTADLHLTLQDWLKKGSKMLKAVNELNQLKIVFSFLVLWQFIVFI